MICTCPAATALKSITAVSCPENFGQLQKIAFQRMSASGVKNSFTSVTPIGTLASWTALKSAADSTKIVISPFVNAPAFEAGAARTYGGGNDTLGGKVEILGAEPTTFNGVLRKMPSATVRDLKALMCEPDLGAFFFFENGTIAAIQDPNTATTYYPIPIQSLFVGDKAIGGLETPDQNVISFSLAEGWSDHLAVAVPTDFNPLTDL